jgi:hypothetical protein
MKKKRPFNGFIGWIIIIFNLKAIFLFKFLNLYAQPVYLWGAHASVNLHVLVSKVLSGTWGTAGAALQGDYLCSLALRHNEHSHQHR